MKSDIIEEISRFVAVDKDSLLEKGIVSLLRERKREIMLDRLGMLSRYKVSSAEELEGKIREGEVEEHPAWEDLIILENFDSALGKIDGYLANL